MPNLIWALFVLFAFALMPASAQRADEVLDAARRVNQYFVQK